MLVMYPWSMVASRRSKTVSETKESAREPKYKKTRAQRFLVGQAKSSTNLIRIKRKALFASRFNPSVSEKDILDSLKSFNFGHFKCLNTKFSS